MHFSNYLYQAFEDHCLPEPLYQKFQICHQTYVEAATKKCSVEKAESLCSQWLKVIIDDLRIPSFSPLTTKKFAALLIFINLGSIFFRTHRRSKISDPTPSPIRPDSKLHSCWT